MMPQRVLRRALEFQGRHAKAISLLLSVALSIALLFAFLGWRTAVNAQDRVNILEARAVAEDVGKGIADVTTCFNAAQRRPGLLTILRGIAVELDPDPRQAMNELIDRYGRDTPTEQDCIALARERDIDPAPYIKNPPSEAAR